MLLYWIINIGWIARPVEYKKSFKQIIKETYLKKFRLCEVSFDKTSFMQINFL